MNIHFDIYGLITTTVKSLPYVSEGIPAGFPSPAADYIGDRIDLNEVLILSPGATYYARVRDYYLVEEELEQGDGILFDTRLAPRTGDLAFCEVCGERVLKYIRKRGRELWLLGGGTDDTLPVDGAPQARGVGGDDRKLSYIVSLVLIVVVPMIYLMPWLAHAILPHIFDDPHVVQEVAGAWIGGTIDTTSGVAASSMIVGEVANQHAVIIKAAQNVLIGVVAFFIALYLSTRRGDKAGQAPSLGIVWEKFPKFIIGFVAASLVFSVLQGNGLFTADARGKLAEPGVAKMFSTVFFSLAFVCVGLDTRLKDIVSRENRNLLWAFLAAQAFNIVVTFLIALVLFGVLKPMLG